MSLATGFPPIASRDARVLVLGSMPSVASLAQQQYYGHPRNAFWPIMGRMFGATPELPYAERKRILCAQCVAVWDVLEQCYREGSLDTSIRADSERANDLLSFFRRHQKAATVFFNGQKAEAAYRRHVLPTLKDLDREIRYERLPSTSPAHAGRTLAEKCDAWQVVRDAVEQSVRQTK